MCRRHVTAMAPVLPVLLLVVLLLTTVGSPSVAAAAAARHEATTAIDAGGAREDATGLRAAAVDGVAGAPVVSASQPPTRSSPVRRPLAHGEEAHPRPAPLAANDLRNRQALAERAAAVLSTAGTNAIGPSTGLAAEAQERHGTILSGGVIASVTVALVFACLLLALVLAEVIAMVHSFLAHRRMRAARKASGGGDNPAEPKYGDLRDTDLNVHA